MLALKVCRYSAHFFTEKCTLKSCCALYTCRKSDRVFETAIGMKKDELLKPETFLSELSQMLHALCTVLEVKLAPSIDVHNSSRQL